MNETHDDHPDMGWSKVGERRKKKANSGPSSGIFSNMLFCSFFLRDLLRVTHFQSSKRVCSFIYLCIYGLQGMGSARVVLNSVIDRTGCSVCTYLEYIQLCT
jgi:hypothetical protein